MSSIVRTIPIPGTLDTAKASLYKWGTSLPAGYVYYINSAYMHPSTNMASGAGSGSIFTLRDEDGNAIASLSQAASAIAASGTAFGSFSSTYREIDASSTQHYLYVDFANSGSFSTYPIDTQIVVNIEVRKSATV